MTDVYLYAIGSHSTRKNEILAQAWIVHENYMFERNVTALIDVRADTKLLGVTTIEEESIHEVYISYLELTSTGVQGKVLIVNMLNAIGLQTYPFTPKKTSSNYKMFSFKQIETNFLYSGVTDYLSTYGTASNQVVHDWRQSGR